MDPQTILNMIQQSGILNPQDPTKNRFSNAETHIRREGTKIILPSEPFPMRYDEAISCLQRKMKEEETEVSINETVDAFPFDGAYAFMKAMKEIYGWASPVPTPSFFGPIPPKTINLEIDSGVYTQIIWGDFVIPGIDGRLTTGYSFKDGRPIFCIKGAIKKKYQADIAQLANKTRELVKNESIYKGKAINLKTNDKGDIDFSEPPSFLNLTKVNPEELTFSAEVEAQVQTNLFTPIEYTEACRMQRIPLKRGVLLEGPFGTGKTLTAFVTALKARENGWTFILVDRVAGLKDALRFARMYQPSVVFAEDIDRAIAGQERTQDIDDILNTIDGIESKGSEVITILTSNDVKGINRAMLRPGRLDAIISVQAPDEAAAAKLVRIYSIGLIDEETDLTEASKELKGQIPAVIREVVERSKLYAISRARNGNIKLSGTDIAHAARGMKAHIALMNPAGEAEKSTHEKMGSAMADLVEESVKRNGLYSSILHTKEKVDHIHERIK